MARFYASVYGNRGTKVTKPGTAKTGIDAHIRGWDSGIQVVASDDNGTDCFSVYATNGSNGEKANKLCKLLGELRLKDGQLHFYASETITGKKGGKFRAITPADWNHKDTKGHA